MIRVRTRIAWRYSTAGTKRWSRKESGQRLSSGGSFIARSAPLRASASCAAADSVVSTNPRSSEPKSGRSNGAVSTPIPRSASSAARVFACVARRSAVCSGFSGSSSISSSTAARS